MQRIPKKIHYCWFGKTPTPKIFERCLDSWKRYCPDYEIIRWDETNFNFDNNEYLKKTYNLKKYANFTDYFRLKIIYDHGGIYLDIDVELIKPLNELLNYKSFFSMQDDYYFASGLGFGAEKRHPLIQKLMTHYENIANQIDQNYEFDICPITETNIIRENYEIDGLKVNVIDNNIFLPREFMCPVPYISSETFFTDNTISIHHFSASWIKPRQRFKLTLIRVFTKLVLKVSRAKKDRQLSVDKLSAKLDKFFTVILFPEIIIRHLIKKRG